MINRVTYGNRGETEILPGDLAEYRGLHSWVKVRVWEVSDKHTVCVTVTGKTQNMEYRGVNVPVYRTGSAFVASALHLSLRRRKGESK